VNWQRWIDLVTARLRAIAGLRRAEDDLDDEVAFHIAMQARANEARGMTAGEAARRARVSLGGVEHVKTRSREARTLRWAQTFGQDARYALRSLVRSPGFAAVALLTLALGIGANLAMFTIVNGVLLRPLPYAEAESLVRVYHANPRQGVRDGSTSLPDIIDWRDRTPALASIGGFYRLPTIVTGQGDPLQVQVAYVTADFFRTLGTPAQLGRTLDATDQQARRRAVISDRLWRTAFAANPRAIGSTITVRAGAVDVVGVMPAVFRFPETDTDIWMPETLNTDQMVGARVRGNKRFEAVARLGKGTNPDRAQRDLSAVARQLSTEHRENADWNEVAVVPLRTAIVGDVDRALALAFTVVGVILLIGCANLANLLLARGAARGNEIALRTALGAGRMRIVRQLLTESLVLAVLGGALGVAVGAWAVDAVVAASAGTLPRIEDVRVDAATLGFAALVVLMTSLIFGGLPAMRVALAEPLDHLRGSRGVVGRGHGLRRALVVTEVALAVLLAVSAGLMARSFLALRTVDPGFTAEGVLAVSMQMNVAGVPPTQMGGFIIRRREEIIDRIAALPGVTSAGTIDSLPLRDDGGTIDFTRPDGAGRADDMPVRAEIRIAHSGYFTAMGIPLLTGEPMPRQVADRTDLPVLVSDTAARRFWPGVNPIGKRLATPGPGGRMHVIGVVGDVRQADLAEAPQPVVYVAQAVAPNIISTVAVRTAGNPLALAEPIRQAIREIDPNQPIRSMEPLTGVIAESIARDRFFTALFVGFGGLALLLAAIGIYGVVAYAVGQQTQEIGVRMALGASAADVLQMILGRGMRPVLLGAAIGIGSAAALTRVLNSQLYGVTATDPGAFAGAVTLLIGAAALACYVPARRAMRISPIAALRDD
jgi:predicted permease